MKRLFILFLIILVVFIALVHFNQDKIGVLFFGWDSTVFNASKLPELVEGAPRSPNDSPRRTSEPSTVESLALEITAGAASDYARMAAIYDWITHNIAYDMVKLKNMSAYGSGAEYVLGTRKGVCHDYADLARALLTAAGIEATYESGEVYASPGKTELHAWNRARVDGAWYALDTTWGSGFISEEEDRFYSKPRRIYLTTPDELNRLHRDPAYKEEQELEYMRRRALESAPVFMPEYERHLADSFNRHRAARGLQPLAAEAGLLDQVRRSAARLAGDIANQRDYSFAELEREIDRVARDFRIAQAGFYAYMQWSQVAPPAEKLSGQIVAEQSGYLERAAFQSVVIGVVQQGDLFTVIHIYLEHY